MKRFITILLLLGAVAIASTEGGNPEVVASNPTDVNHCDFIEHMLGLCKNSENILEQN